MLNAIRKPPERTGPRIEHAKRLYGSIDGPGGVGDSSESRPSSSTSSLVPHRPPQPPSVYGTRPGKTLAHAALSQALERELLESYFKTAHFTVQVGPLNKPRLSSADQSLLDPAGDRSVRVQGQVQPSRPTKPVHESGRPTAVRGESPPGQRRLVRLVSSTDGSSWSTVPSRSCAAGERGTLPTQRSSRHGTWTLRPN